MSQQKKQPVNQGFSNFSNTISKAYAALFS